MQKTLLRLSRLAGALGLASGAAQATTIPPTINSTLTITTNSKLTTDVSCTVTGAPCIKFGSPSITLNLNATS